MHIAAAVGTPVVALFEPTCSIRTAPHGTGHAVLTHDVSCRPSYNWRCVNSVRGMFGEYHHGQDCRIGFGATDSSVGTPVKILLVRPDRIGDEILCLPVASALRRLMPQARIAFLSSDYAAPIFDYHPDVDEVLTVSGQETFRQLVGLFRRGFHAVVFFMPYRRLMLAAFVARVPVRVASGYRWYSFLATHRVYQHRHDFTKHESEYNLGLLSGLELEPGPSQLPCVVVTDAERQWAHKRLHKLPPRRVIVHPGGFTARHWQGVHYWDFIHRLDREGIGVVLTGSTVEGQRFRSEAPNGSSLQNCPLDLMGQLTLRELMAVISVSDVLVSGATGPAHLAAALGVPTVSIFDPRRSNLPIRWSPLGKGVVLRPEVPTCPKCIYEDCPYWDCMDRITVDQVAASVWQMLDLQGKA